MLYDIFKTEEEKAEARLALPLLMEQPGWKFLVRALQANVQHFSEELREKKDFKNVEEVYALQDRISDLESYAELPLNLLAEVQIEDEDEEEDPYPDK